MLVVGAGISGLTVGWHLRKLLGESERVIVVDSNTRPGGTAWTERQQGFSLETGPNGFLDNKPSTLELCRDLGLADELIRAGDNAKNRYVFLGDRLRRLPTSPGEFLRSDLLSWKGKLRVLSERWRKPGNGDDESIYDFGCRRIGKEATEKLLDAFVTGTLAGDPQLLSLPACFPRMAELESTYGSLIRAQGQLAKERRRQGKERPTGGPGGALTATRGGMRTIIEKLALSFEQNLHLGEGICRLQRDGAEWVASTPNKTYRTRCIVLACPAYAQADILAEVDATLAEEIRSIPYTCAVVAVVGYAREQLADCPLEGFGYLTPQRLGRAVLGMLWSSSIFPDQAPEGYYQFRAILGGWKRRDVLNWNDAEILAAVRADLKQTLQIQSEPSFTWIHRWEKAIPQYHVGHLKRLEKIEQRQEKLRGLYLTGNCYRGVSLNDCTLQASQIADLIVQQVWTGGA